MSYHEINFKQSDILICIPGHPHAEEVDLLRVETGMFLMFLFFFRTIPILLVVSWREDAV